MWQTLSPPQNQFLINLISNILYEFNTIGGVLEVKGVTLGVTLSPERHFL